MAMRVVVAQIGHGSWATRIPGPPYVASVSGMVTCNGCGHQIHESKLAAHRPWCSNANMSRR